MQPAHYALTEILIVLSCIYSIKELSIKKNYFAIIGISLIGIAALVGAIKFGLLNNELMIQLNQKLGFYAGFVCISFICIQMALNLEWGKISKLLILLALLTIVLSIFLPKQYIIYYLFFWSSVSIILVLFFQEKDLTKKVLRAFKMSILILSFLTLSRNGIFVEAIGPMTSFHLFHILIALWIYLINSLIHKNITYQN
tara:strand:+ start:4434 stop:5030 length:597 start_codon:yes stop_codon:yes gene_type:complete